MKKIKINVVNQKYHKPRNDHVQINIMRPSILSNPFYMKNESDRDKVVDEHYLHLKAEYAKKGAVYQNLMRLVALYDSGRNIDLICCCAPKRCHGDNIKKAIIGISNNLKK